MREKRVLRFWCDYCKKAGLQIAAMRKHELHCTLNPNRECGMCGIYDKETKPMPELLEILKDVADSWKDYGYGEDFPYESFSADSAQMKSAMESLEVATEGCPACKLAAIRQSKIPVPCTDFDFKKECDAWWSEINQDRNGANEYYRG